MQAPKRLLRRALPLGFALATALASAAPTRFDLPPADLSEALVAFAKASNVDVLFSSESIGAARSAEIHGDYEPAEALQRLLADSGFTARRLGRDQYVVSAATMKSGVVRGRIVGPDGAPAAGVLVALPDASLSTTTGSDGRFAFAEVSPGNHRLWVRAEGMQPLRMTGLLVAAGRTLALETQTLSGGNDITELTPFEVNAQNRRLGSIGRGAALLSPRTAGGNLDLPRSQDGSLPFTIHNREQIERSGAVNLNTFLQRELLAADAATPPPERSGTSDTFHTGSSNLNLRGYGTDATVILLNGRRLPESPPAPGSAELAAPDVNFIPLSLVQQIEVLPISSSALYSGNPIGGVINIVLRPDIDSTEISTTYTNALDSFSAPQSVISLQHGRTLLDGRLRLRFNASRSESAPPTKSDLGYTAAVADAATAEDAPLYGATPNLRSADGSPLLAGSPSAVTSVAPGATGNEGLAAFSGRAGVRDFGLFTPDAEYMAAPSSAAYPFGRREERTAYFAAATYDVLSWLQLGGDLIHTDTTVTRGFDLFSADLTLATDNPLNPFGREVVVSLQDYAPALGESYNEARLDFSAFVLAALVRLPGEWRLALDNQYTTSTTDFRGIVGADPNRWQGLVDRGLYNPLRDTGVFAAPSEFYDEVLVYQGGRDRHVSISRYTTIDGALRLTNQNLRLPTGLATLALGADFRRIRLAPQVDEEVYGDGSPASARVQWTGRTLDRYSFFGELQAPLLPARWLPGWLRSLEADLGGRYVASDNANEANFAPTAGLKAGFGGGLALRTSIATANRFPTPYMGKRTRLDDDPTPGPGPIIRPRIYDPILQRAYTIVSRDAPNTKLKAESAVTKTVGLIYETGEKHRWRASLDLYQTDKTNEQVYLSAQTLANLESLWPSRVTRAPSPTGIGEITNISTGTVNLAWRKSTNLNLAVDYAWSDCLGGTFEAFGRWLGYLDYKRRILPTSPIVDELGAPDGTAAGLLRNRASFGASWSNDNYGFGIDGHYFGPRHYPVAEIQVPPPPQISAYWQFDVHAQCELSRLAPKLVRHRGLRVQARIDNVFNSGFPRYRNDPSGAGYQCYGDWRGRTYSLSLTATF